MKFKIKRNLNHSPILGDIYDVLEKRERDDAITIIDGMFSGLQLRYAAEELRMTSDPAMVAAVGVILHGGKSSTQLVTQIVDHIRLESASAAMIIDENCPCCVALAADLVNESDPKAIDDVLRIPQMREGMTIICDNNPEWGTFRVLKHYESETWEIRGDAGDRVLTNSEFAQFWSVEDEAGVGNDA